jgi:OOP family OmpA-OmpF porin
VAEARVTYQLPVGVWDGTRVPVEAVDGDVVARAYRIEGAGQATLDLMAGLRRQLQAAGYSVRLDCEVRACGGFDFRFAVALLPEPEMHVDLGDFRALAASKGGEHVFVVASRSENAGFVQITTVSPAGTAPQPVAEAPAVPDPTGEASIATSGGAEGARPDATDLAAALERDGHVVLGDLVFATGSSALGEGEFASLAALAAYLAANPGAQVALVGHTDAEGSLAANIAVSEARARSVRERLIAAHGADPARLTAEGVGYLAPLAPNATAEGRQKNRRVEAVLTSTR